jgi:hypothetical protein
MATHADKGPIVVLKVTLANVRPAVWRRIEVPAAIRLDHLHHTLQKAMGWEDSHLHQFVFTAKPNLPSRADLKKSRLNLRKLDLAEIRGVHVYSLPEFDLHDAEDETQTTLEELAQPRSKFTYVYDLGDDWIHTIDVEKISAPAKGVKYPRCIDGQGACPPEDSGGPIGYAMKLKDRANKKSAGHAFAKQWLGKFDPDHFDVKAVDRALRRRA